MRREQARLAHLDSIKIQRYSRHRLHFARADLNQPDTILGTSSFLNRLLTRVWPSSGRAGRIEARRGQGAICPGDVGNIGGKSRRRHRRASTSPKGWAEFCYARCLIEVFEKSKTLRIQRLQPGQAARGWPNSRLSDFRRRLGVTHPAVAHDRHSRPGSRRRGDDHKAGKPTCQDPGEEAAEGKPDGAGCGSEGVTDDRQPREEQPESTVAPESLHRGCRLARLARDRG